MSTEKTISQIYTSCRECVFANYKNNTQIGCKLNKIEDYKNANIEVLDMYDDEGKEFFIINERFCLFFRTKELMEKHPINTWEEIVKLQTKVPYNVILFLNKEDTLKDLKNSIKQIQNQEIKPNLITIVNKQYLSYVDNPDKYIKPSKILEILSNSNIHKYSIKNIYDDDLIDRDLIDLCYDSNKDNPYPFYVVFKANKNIPEEFSKEFNSAILIKMLQLGFVKPIDDLHGMIVNKIAHKKHAGNSFGIPIEDKILKYEQNGNNFIFEAKDICPCLMR